MHRVTPGEILMISLGREEAALLDPRDDRSLEGAGGAELGEMMGKMGGPGGGLPGLPGGQGLLPGFQNFTKKK